MDNCSHLNLYDSKDQKEKPLNILKCYYASIYESPEKLICTKCISPFYLHVCLTCNEIYCFESDHFLEHFTATSHSLYFNIEKRIIYCYECKHYTTNKFIKELNEIDFIYENDSIEKNLEPDPILKIDSNNLNERIYKTMPCSILKGAVNLGNTCYLNSVLQVLINNPICKNYFLSPEHDKKLCIEMKNFNLDEKEIPQFLKKNKTTVKIKKLVSGIKNEIENKKKFDEGMLLKYHCCITCSLKDVFVDVYSSSSSLVFNDFYYALCRNEKCFVGSHQQDAHELLTKLFSLLHTCHKEYIKGKENFNEQNNENRISKFKKSSLISNSKESKIKSNSEKNNEIKTKEAYISDLIDCNCIPHSIFHIIIKILQKCEKCLAETVFIESFLNLPLSFKNKKNETNSRSLISEMIDGFFEEEKISDPLYCKFCKCNTPATRKYKIKKVPEILILHLKRFTVKKGVPMKIDDEIVVDRRIVLDENIYKLYASINHMGTISSGHYNSYIHTCNSFVCFDDEKVNEISINISFKDAYLLFYEKICN